MAAEEIFKGNDGDRRGRITQHKTAVVAPSLRNLRVIECPVAHIELSARKIYSEAGCDYHGYHNNDNDDLVYEICAQRLQSLHLYAVRAITLIFCATSRSLSTT